MAENSNIEWTDHTFNPWEGCSKVSAGCKHCYAENRAKRFGTVEWGVNGKRRKTSAANWKKPIKWNKLAGGKGVRERVFCASLADVFEEKADQPEMVEWRGELLGLIEDTPHLDWLLLTKRPENVRRLIEEAITWLAFPNADEWLKSNNVWIGTSVENQEQADKRIPELLRIPARVRFLSMEPLLGPVNLNQVRYNGILDIDTLNGLAGWPTPHENFLTSKAWPIEWVIVGGESGHGARPMHPDWVRSIRQQCDVANVPFLFKQWGKYVPLAQNDHTPYKAVRSLVTETGEHLSVKEGLIAGEPNMIIVANMGKKKSGRMLDGRTWDEFPQTNLSAGVK